MQPTRPVSPELTKKYKELGYWRDRCSDEYLLLCARECPDKVAVVDGDRRMTFADVDRQAARFAAALVDLGVRPGEVVTFQLPNCAEAVVVHQGIHKLGAVSNPVIPIYRGRELRFILGQGRAKVAVIPATYRGFDFVDLYQRLRSELPDLQHVIVVGGKAESFLSYTELMAKDWENKEELVRIIDARPRDPDAVALLLYTSGTTADPKGALHSHNTYLFDTEYLVGWYQLNERDVIFNPSPITHMTGVMFGLTAPFILGTRVVLQDIWDPNVALQLIERERCTFMGFATPFLAGITYSPERTKYDLSTIRYIICGGADIPQGLIRDATREVGCVTRMYGATELPSATCHTRWDPLEKRITTEGRWMFPTEWKILDEDGREVPTGAVGEALWRGPDLFLGYLDPKLNEESFTPDGFCRTGDQVVMDEEGYLRVAGRKKDIINRGGEKFSAKEVEDLIYELPVVSEAAVVGMPDPVLVERACAFVVLKAGVSLTLKEVTQYMVAREISKYKLPERLEVVPELPKTASGKIQKFVLRQMIAQKLKEEGKIG